MVLIILPSDLNLQQSFNDDDFICNGHILNDIIESLFDYYQFIESAIELLELLKSKYIAEDGTSKSSLLIVLMNIRYGIQGQ